MKLKIGFRKVNVTTKGGVEYLSDAKGVSTLYLLEDQEVSNIDDCEKALDKAVVKLDEHVLGGTKGLEKEIEVYRVILTHEGRKVRNFDEWKKTEEYIEV